MSGLEKTLFPWRAAALIKSRPVFFAGCNLVNFLPDTALETLNTLGTYGCGWMFDCCGKPLSMNGDHAGAASILNRIEMEIRRHQIPEMIVACPNCYQVFEKKLSIPVTNIYDFLKREGYQASISPSVIPVFSPCPDRGSGKMASSIEGLTGARLLSAGGLPCCGLGIRQPDKSKQALETIRKADPELKAIGASWYGHLRQNGIRIKGHLLSEVIGVKESPSKGLKMALNRMRPKLWPREGK